MENPTARNALRHGANVRCVIDQDPPLSLCKRGRVPASNVYWKFPAAVFVIAFAQKIHEHIDKHVLDISRIASAVPTDGGVSGDI
jgi:hypothetical protein